MFCKECGEMLTNDNAVICVKCGTNKGVGNKFCHQCGKPVKSDNAEVCLSCGVKLKGNKVTDLLGSGNNNKLIAGLLAIFLGELGIHRFYLGYKQIGFIQLGVFIAAWLIFPLAAIVSFVWAIVDAVQIFSGKLPNESGEKLI